MRANAPISLPFSLILLASPGCQSAPPATEAAPAAPPPAPVTASLPQPGDPAESPCVRDCLEQSQMQARAWEAIVADCRHTCAEKKTP
ncbi:MAG: hypothetical protein H6706_02055 [Myxococcales bacterium]|nr:hypothetical protein [Myxococcales bacterium]